MSKHTCYLLSGLGALGALALLPLAFAQPGGKPPEGKPALPPAAVYVTAVQQRPVAARQSIVGSVMPVRASTVGSAVSGRVEEFLVNEGDRVRRGQPVARLRTGIVAAELANAVGELKLRQAELKELEAGSRPEEKAQAKAREDRAQAIWEWRKAKKARALAAGRGVSVEELEEAISQAVQAEEAYREAKAAYKLLEPREEKVAQARAKMEAQKAEVEKLEEQLARHTVYAPFDGYVVAEHTEVGQWVLQGAPVAEIAELDEVDVEVPLLEDYVAGLKVGDTARVEINALPEQLFTGRVAHIVPRANLRARTFPVKVRVPNKLEASPQTYLLVAAGAAGLMDNPLSAAATVGAGSLAVERTRGVLLKAGMVARVTLAVGKKERALLVPRDAVVLGGLSRVVYIVDPAPGEPGKGTARPVPVELGVADGDLIEVRGELRAEQQVVIEGNERLIPGQPVIVLSRAAKGK